jgi:hypothetical protein
MAQVIVNVPPLDPNLYTGLGRLIAAPARTGNVTLNTPYGPNGVVEFASRLWCGTTGSISYVKWDGTVQVLNGAQAGIWHHIYSIQVNSSGTTATGLVWGS